MDRSDRAAVSKNNLLCSFCITLGGSSMQCAQNHCYLNGPGISMSRIVYQFCVERLQAFLPTFISHKKYGQFTVNKPTFLEFGLNIEQKYCRIKGSFALDRHRLRRAIVLLLQKMAVYRARNLCHLQHPPHCATATIRIF